MVTYSINLKELEKNYNYFRKWGEVFFPVKTNHNQIVLDKLKKLGSGFECDCLEHIKKVYSKKTAKKIIFSNVAKRKEDILWAIKHGINFFTVDDKETLLIIIENAKKYGIKKLKINLRLNVYDIFLREFVKKHVQDSRLGASVAETKELIEVLNEQKNIKIERGISFYVQAEVHDNKKMLDDVSNYLVKNFDKNLNLDWINIGGGSSIERLEFSRQKLYDNLAKLGVSRIILEPGRYMMSGVEDVAVGVIRCAEKDADAGEMVASLEMGIYHGLIDIKLHNRKFDFYIKNGESCAKLALYKNGVKLVLRGPTADSSDIIGVYQMPKIKVDKNAVFIIKNVGAYVEVLDSDFSGKIDKKFLVI